MTWELMQFRSEGLDLTTILEESTGLDVRLYSDLLKTNYKCVLK